MGCLLVSVRVPQLKWGSSWICSWSYILKDVCSVQVLCRLLCEGHSLQAYAFSVKRKYELTRAVSYALIWTWPWMGNLKGCLMKWSVLAIWIYKRRKVVAEWFVLCEILELCVNQKIFIKWSCCILGNIFWCVFVVLR